MTGIDKVTFAKCNTRALPLDLWPETDRTSWIAACQPPARLKPGGRAGHLRQTTRDHYAERYACFLGFLQRTGLLQSEGAPAVNVTPDKVDAYLADLKGRVASTTTHDLDLNTAARRPDHCPWGRRSLALRNRERSRPDEATTLKV